MKKLILLYALLVSFTSSIAQNIDKLKKRELRELANTQKKQLEIKNSKIDDQITTIDDQISTIDDQATVIKNSSARITALIQIQTELQNITLLNQKSINKLNTNNAIIPGLKNEIIKLTDSINSINNLLSSYKSKASFSIKQNSYGFLNNLYKGNSQIENQTFRLVPAGVIATNNIIQYNSDDYNYERETPINQFIPLAKLNFEYKTKRITKIILGAELYNLYPEIFPTFSFLKGKLLTIKNENVSKDFLFSVKQSQHGLPENLGQKEIYFSLTDDNENEYLLELIVINNEVYLRINSEESGGHNNSLENIGMKWSVWSDKQSYKSKLVDQLYISPWLISSTYESSVRITPDMFLFKLEEIQ